MSSLSLKLEWDALANDSQIGCPVVRRSRFGENNRGWSGAETAVGFWMGQTGADFDAQIRAETVAGRAV